MTQPNKNIVWLEVDGDFRKCRVSDLIMHFFMKLQPSRHPERPERVTDSSQVCRIHFKEISAWVDAEDDKRKRRALLASEIVRVGAFELAGD